MHFDKDKQDPYILISYFSYYQINIVRIMGVQRQSALSHETFIEKSFIYQVNLIAFL